MIKLLIEIRVIILLLATLTVLFCLAVHVWASDPTPYTLTWWHMIGSQLPPVSLP